MLRALKKAPRRPQRRPTAMQKIKVLSIRKVVGDETKAVRNQLHASTCTLLGDWSVPDQNGVSLQPGPTCTCKAAERYVRYISQCHDCCVALYSRTDPAPPANNMTFLAAGGINDHNMQLYIPDIQYMSYLLTCPRVHCISLQQFLYSKKKNSEKTLK